VININLNTAELTITDVTEVNENLYQFVKEIKNNTHNGRLFTFKYYSYGKKIIDIDYFIKMSIEEVVLKYSQYADDYFYENSILRKNLRSKANLYILRRLQNDFCFNFSSRKTVNQFLKYIKLCVQSAAHHHFKKLVNLRENKYYLIGNAVRLGADGIYRKTPEMFLIEKENISEIWDCINGLSRKQRVALVESCINEKSQKEISLLLGNSQQAVSALIAKARKTLKKALKAKGFRFD